MPLLSSEFEVNRIEGGGLTNPITACNLTTEFGTALRIYIDNKLHVAPADIDIGDHAFTDADITTAWDGEDEYYGFRAVGDSGAPTYVFKIAADGEITDKIACLGIGSFSVTGSIPYVDYYAGNFYMYKTGSKHYSSIEGAVSQSVGDQYMTFSGSTFNDFISASIPWGFDESITGTITDPSTQVSSSLQFQGYPHSGSVGSGIGSGGGCDLCCVHDSMLISTPMGEMHVSKLKVGDKVDTYNLHTKQKEIQPILGTVKVIRDNDYKINNLIMTSEHPVYLENGELASIDPIATLENYKMKVAGLKIGDKMITHNGSLETVNTIEKIEGNQPNYTIYTKNDNFYANKILVDSVALYKF